MGRGRCCDKGNVKRGAWSPEEDALLKDFIHKHGGIPGNWISLPLKAGLKRCGKSCRLRWLNYLRPNIKHGQFSQEEDTIICNLYATIGSRWSIIAGQLPGRTDNDIKNYWNTKLKKKLVLPNFPFPQSQAQHHHQLYNSLYYTTTTTHPQPQPQPQNFELYNNNACSSSSSYNNNNNNVVDVQQYMRCSSNMNMKMLSCCWAGKVDDEGFKRQQIINEQQQQQEDDHNTTLINYVDNQYNDQLLLLLQYISTR